MIDYINLGDMLPAIKDKLDEGGTVSLTVTGNSMRPLFKSSVDRVDLVKPVFPLKKYDMPLHIRPDGHFVLHRVISFDGEKYKIRGDNCFYDEFVPEKDIIALVSAFTHKDKKYTVNDFVYKLYCPLRCSEFSYFIRSKIYWPLRRIGSKIKRKIIKK